MHIVPKRMRDMIPDGVYVFHMCTAHNERVYHRTTHRDHPSYLYPCNSCKYNNYESFEDRHGGS